MNFFIIDTIGRYHAINREKNEITELEDGNDEWVNITRDCKKSYEIDKKENFNNKNGLLILTKRYYTLKTGQYLYFFSDNLVLETNDKREFENKLEEIEKERFLNGK